MLLLIWAQPLEILFGSIIWFDYSNQWAIQWMNQAMHRFENQPNKWIWMQSFQITYTKENLSNVQWAKAGCRASKQYHWFNRYSILWALPQWKIRARAIYQTGKGCSASLLPFVKAYSINQGKMGEIRPLATSELLYATPFFPIVTLLWLHRGYFFSYQLSPMTPFFHS